MSRRSRNRKPVEPGNPIRAEFKRLLAERVEWALKRAAKDNDNDHPNQKTV